MTDQANIDALTRCVLQSQGGCHMPREQAATIAAAVLELVRPKRLEWTENFYGDARVYVAHHDEKKYVYGVDFAGKFYAQTPDGESDHPTLAAAQSAAQAHADAAHWANTKLGELVGVK